jgi:hypothetical protein
MNCLSLMALGWAMGFFAAGNPVAGIVFLAIMWFVWE